MKHSSDHSLWVIRIPLLLLVIVFLFLRTSTASRLLPPTQPGDSLKVLLKLQVISFCILPRKLTANQAHFRFLLLSERDSDKVAGFLQAGQVGEEEKEDTWDVSRDSKDFF